MEYIIVGLTVLVLFLCGYILKLKGYRITRIKPEIISEEKKREAERRMKEFEEVMSYNLAKALERKR